MSQPTSKPTLSPTPKARNPLTGATGQLLRSVQFRDQVQVGGMPYTHIDSLGTVGAHARVVCHRTPDGWVRVTPVFPALPPGADGRGVTEYRPQEYPQSTVIGCEVADDETAGIIAANVARMLKERE